MRDELPSLTTWQQIGLIMATPGYDDNGSAFLDKSDMADIARLLDEYKAERDAERDALNGELKEAIADHIEAVKNTDEARRWVDELEAEAAALRTALADALDWLENAPISYANGNVHNGMDEGDVLGGRQHEKLVAQLRVALNTGGSEVVREFPVGEFANNDHQ